MQIAIENEGNRNKEEERKCIVFGVSLVEPQSYDFTTTVQFP